MKQFFPWRPLATNFSDSFWEMIIQTGQRILVLGTWQWKRIPSSLLVGKLKLGRIFVPSIGLWDSIILGSWWDPYFMAYKTIPEYKWVVFHPKYIQQLFPGWTRHCLSAPTAPPTEPSFRARPAGHVWVKRPAPSKLPWNGNRWMNGQRFGTKISGKNGKTLKRVFWAPKHSLVVSVLKILFFWGDAISITMLIPMACNLTKL